MHTASVTIRAAMGPIALAATIAIATATTARAQEYCVACSGPDAFYRCVLERAVPTGIPLQFLCVKTLAREGGHATCAVRSGTVFECDAPIRRIDTVSAAERLSPAAVDAPQEADSPRPLPAVGFAPEAPSGPGQPGMPHSVPADQDRPPRDGSEPHERRDPETVEELAKTISRSSKETFVKAGEAIKTTSRKTWDCVSSFFKSC